MKNVIINPVEPSPLSIRAAVGVPFDVVLAFLDLTMSPVDPTPFMPQIALMPRSILRVSAYDLDTVDAGAGTCSASIPGTFLNDVNGYNVEVYSRRVADNPDDPPVPVKLLAKGVLRLEGSAYMVGGPLGMISVPVVVGPQGPVGPVGPEGPPNVLSIGTVETSDPGTDASASITGTSPAQELNLVLPRGIEGPPNVLTVGTVTTGAPGSSADVDITGTSPDQVVNFTIPRGDVGAPNVLSVGTVTTLPAGSPATVTITGTAPTQTINFGIPQGIQGNTGANVTLGTVLPGTAVDGALFWNTSTNTLYVRETGVWVVVEATWGS